MGNRSNAAKCFASLLAVVELLLLLGLLLPLPQHHKYKFALGRPLMMLQIREEATRLTSALQQANICSQYECM